MSAAVEASQHMQALAQPWQVCDSVKAAIRRASRAAGIPEKLGKRLWYGEARRIDSEVMDSLRAAVAARQDARALERTRERQLSLHARLAAVEAALGLPSPNDRGGLDHGGVGAGGAPDRAVAAGG